MAERDKPNTGMAANETGVHEACPKYWIAAYNRPRSEKEAASELDKSGIETCCVATQTQRRICGDRKKHADIPFIIHAEPIYRTSL